MTINIDWLRGCATALVTPFTATGAIDEQRLRNLIEYQIEGGVKILIPCGTTGESATLSESEDRRVIKFTVDAAAGRARVIAGTGSNSTTAAVEYSVAARDLAVDGVLVVAPYYNKPTQAGMFAHFKVIADAVENLPVILYNVPGRTSSNIAADTVLSLASSCPNIVGIKEASGNFSQIMSILKSRPQGFRVFSGDDSVTLSLIALGADGLVSVASNEAPALMSTMVAAALAGDWTEARALHFKLLPLMEGHFIESSPGPVKAALAIMGLIEENVRLPLVPVHENTRNQMREILNELGMLKESTNAA